VSERLLACALAGDSAALARLLSEIERGGGIAPALMDEVFARSGRAEVIGVTGPPGAGKSTLVAALIAELRRRGKRVAVLAVDPSSPLTGGAILGDRVRMAAISTDPDVFVRSMASRGELGGLALAAPAAIRLLDASGMDVVLVETVGVGQNEVAIAACADCVVLVLAPGAGDGVQAMKAGVLEIADVIAVNKADLPGAEQARADVAAALRLGAGARRVPTVLLTVAESGKGVAELAEAFERRVASQREDGQLAERRLERLRREALERAGWVVRRRILEHPERWLDAALLAGLAERTRDPASVGEAIADRALAAAADERP
jgi:LAO/AO transport system kinase